MKKNARNPVNPSGEAHCKSLVAGSLVWADTAAMALSNRTNCEDDFIFVLINYLYKFTEI